MSNPVVPKTINQAIGELIGAQSALNMVPSPIENPQGEYLSDRDEWAKHAYEHISAVIQGLANLTNPGTSGR